MQGLDVIYISERTCGANGATLKDTGNKSHGLALIAHKSYAFLFYCIDFK